MAPLTFRQFVGRIAEGMVYAQTIADSATLERWKDSCIAETTDGETTYRPKEMRFQIPGGPVVAIPELGVIYPSQFPIDDLKIRFTAMVDLTADEGEITPGKEVAPHITMTPKRGLFNRATEFEVEMSFKLMEPTEIQEAIRDAMGSRLKDSLRGGSNG